MNFDARCDAIEACYEFMLAYAAQGLANDAGSSSGAQIREYLRSAVAALQGIGEQCVSEGVDAGFVAVLVQDSASSLAAVNLVLAQPAISSQLIDNLNASIHLRALLTDLFLIDETLKLKALQ